MRLTTILTTLTLISAASLARAADPVIDTFDDGRSSGNWTFGGLETFPGTGGNPGWYMQEDRPDYPHLRTVGPSAFTGDWAAAGVTSVGVDFITLVRTRGSYYPLSVEVATDNGTPDDLTDDWLAYFVGEQSVPRVGEPWTSFTFAIDSQTESKPAGWVITTFSGVPLPDGDWARLMKSVTQLRFSYIPFGTPGNFPRFTVGADNATIAFAADCPADLNGDGLVDFADYLDFLNLFDAQDPRVDFNHDGLVDFSDYLEFLNLYETGC